MFAVAAFANGCILEALPAFSLPLGIGLSGPRLGGGRCIVVLRVLLNLLLQVGDCQLHFFQQKLAWCAVSDPLFCAFVYSLHVNTLMLSHVF